MKHIAAYLLLQLGGNASPSASDITELLSTVGIEAESERVEKLISELEGKDIAEVSSSPGHFPPSIDHYKKLELTWILIL